MTKDNLKQYGEASGEWFWDQDADLRFIDSPLGKSPYAKYNAADRLGLTRWEAVGADPNNDPHRRKHRNELLSRRSFRDLEYGARDCDGNKLVVRTTGYPILMATVPLPAIAVHRAMSPTRLRAGKRPGGGLRLNSAVGEGTVATVFFPRTRAAAANF